MAKRKKVKSSGKGAPGRSQKSSGRPIEEVDSPNEDEDDSHTLCSPGVQTQSTDSTASNSPRNPERSSTPLIHKKFGKVICPEENEDESSAISHTTDSQTGDNCELNVSKLENHDEEDGDDEHRHLLLLEELADNNDEDMKYEGEIICEEIEIVTTEDEVVTMKEEAEHESPDPSFSADDPSKVFEIDEKLKRVSVSENILPSPTDDVMISNDNSVHSTSQTLPLSSPSELTSNVQSAATTTTTTITTTTTYTTIGGVNTNSSTIGGTLDSRSPWLGLATTTTSQCGEVRSRSGSTDTTSSESGSTSSSSVRRSSRIKQSPHQRHREVVESSSNGNTKCLSLAPPSPTSCSADSPLDKPVKVKSRWRRTSELEMVVGPKPHHQSSDPRRHVSGQSESSAQWSPAESPKPSCDISSLGLPCIEVEEKLKTFETIDFNVYKTDRYTNKRAKEKMICDCFLTKEEWARGEMGCGEDCLNRLLMIECCSRCNLKDRCSNKRFQNLEYAKCEMFKTEMKGFGLRALEDIPADTFLFEYVGEVVDTGEFHRRALGYSQDNNRHYYFMSLRPDAIIDATIKGNISRFINHSCDPNAETQKWTIDGELRIGFFSTRTINRGEELTFDYQYQRYGKEAQKCFCGSKNCRGWIGENPDDEEEEEEEEIEEEEEVESEEGEGERSARSHIKSEEEEEEEAGSGEGVGKQRGAEKMDKSSGGAKARRHVVRVKKVRKKQRDADYVVDDPEKDLEVLCARGIRNKMDTLAVLRIIVETDSEDTRYKVLSLLQCADAPCRRLFIDYHLLKLLYGWMKIADTMSDPPSMKLEILQTLSKLPIPDKTKLKDSNVLQMVTEWSQQTSSTEEPNDNKRVAKTAHKLLDLWSNLVDTFRIPKKERIEQMKEHERAADRGYRETRENASYHRTWDRYRGDIRKDDRYRVDYRKDRKLSRDSPPDHRKDRGPKLTKYEHRQLFALKVQAEDEERRKQEAEWSLHMERCKSLGLDPSNVSGFDENTGYPMFINPPPMGTMIPWFPPTPDLSVGGTPLGPSIAPPIGFGPDGTPIFAPPPFIPPPVPPMGLKLPPPQYPGQPLPGMYPGGIYPSPALPDEPPQQPPLPPPIRLPKFWKTAKDSEGRIYYYQMKTRHSQWEPPPYQPPPPPKPPDDESSSSSSESSESSEEEEEEEEEFDEDEEFDDDKLIKQMNRRSNKTLANNQNASSTTATVLSINSNEISSQSIDNEEEDEPMAVNHQPPPCSTVAEDGVDITNQPSSTVPTSTGKKKKREGLCEEFIISPIQEIEKQKARERKRKIKDTKEKLKQRKLEKKKLVDAVTLGGKRVKAEISSATSSTLKIESAAADTSSSEPARKIKELFRLSMAGVIVHYLNPFRKESCKKGRILSNDDFKHLARKLTHFVLVKELKHCRNVEDLECNDNVKHKAKDFIKKYMSKFGETYARDKEMDV